MNEFILNVSQLKPFLQTFMHQIYNNSN